MWPIVQLGELCENILSGGTPSTESPEFWDNEIPWLSSADILNHKHYIIRKGVSKLWKPNILPKNNILVVTRVGLGKVIINNEDVCFSQDLQGLVLKSAIVDRNYLLYALLNKLTIFKQISRGATIKGVTRNDLISLKIPLPPLSIQQQIADTLDKADALRRKDQELLEKYDELAQAVFYEMFGDVVSSTSKYPVSKFGSEVKIKGGKRLPLGDKLVKQNTGLPYIKAGDIKSGRILTNNLEYLLPETQKKIKNYIVKQGDVCVTIVGANIGDVGVVPKDLDGANLTENAAKLIIMNNERLDNIYLSNYWSMPFVQSQIKLKSMAVGVPKLALFRIEEMDLVLPPLIMQKKFNSIKEIIDKEKNMLIESVQYSNNLFKSLSSKHFE